MGAGSERSAVELDADTALTTVIGLLDRRGVKPGSVAVSASRDVAAWEPIDLTAAE